MATLKAISTKLDLIDGKKSILKKAFEELKLHADSHPTFSSLEWEEIDSYFTSLQSNLFHKFSLLKDQQSKPYSQRNASAQSGFPPLDPIPARSELKSFCEKMDGVGLRNYVNDHPKERAPIRLELSDAYKYAPDPAVLVLDAMQGFFPDGSGFGELGGVRRACVVLLEQFGRLGLEIPEAIKERAQRLAFEWKGKIGSELGSALRGSGGGGRRRGPSAVSRDGLEEGFEKLGLLYLLSVFRLETSIVLDKNELVDYVVAVARSREAPELCHSLDFGDEICDVVQKLIDTGKQLLAVKFIFQFELTDKFPPVTLLKSYISNSRKIANKVRNEGKGSRRSVNEAVAKEISSLKSVLKIIEDHNLEAEYPKDGILKNIERLENGKLSSNSNKRGASNAPRSERPLKQQRDGRSRTTTRRNGGPSGSTRGPRGRTVRPMQQSYVQNADMENFIRRVNKATRVGQSATLTALPNKDILPTLAHQKAQKMGQATVVGSSSHADLTPKSKKHKTVTPGFRLLYQKGDEVIELDEGAGQTAPPAPVEETAASISGGELMKRIVDRAIVEEVPTCLLSIEDEFGKSIAMAASRFMQVLSNYSEARAQIKTARKSFAKMKEDKAELEKRVAEIEADRASDRAESTRVEQELMNKVIEEKARFAELTKVLAIEEKRTADLQVEVDSLKAKRLVELRQYYDSGVRNTLRWLEVERSGMVDMATMAKWLLTDMYDESVRVGQNKVPYNPLELITLERQDTEAGKETWAPPAVDPDNLDAAVEKLEAELDAADDAQVAGEAAESDHDRSSR